VVCVLAWAPFLGQDRTTALAGELPDVHPVLLRLHPGIVRSPERELGKYSVVLLCRVRVGVGITTKYCPFLAIPVLYRETDPVERQADTAPGARRTAEHFEGLVAADARLDRRARGHLRGVGDHQLLGLVLLRAEAHHQAAQEFGLQLGVWIARLPRGMVEKFETIQTAWQPRDPDPELEAEIPAPPDGAPRRAGGQGQAVDGPTPRR